jgi:hypothetical protein
VVVVQGNDLDLGPAQIDTDSYCAQNEIP